MQHNAFEICEWVAEAPVLLHDHVACGKHSAAEAVARLQALMSERELLQAICDVGYFPPNKPMPRI